MKVRPEVGAEKCLHRYMLSLAARALFPSCREVSAHPTMMLLSYQWPISETVSQIKPSSFPLTQHHESQDCGQVSTKPVELDYQTLE